MAQIVAATPEGIALAAARLRGGDLVAMPTETVYGLAGNAADPQAVAKIFATKGRPADHPLIVHVLGADDLPRWAARIPDAAQALARAFWPGPLTMILPRAAGVHDLVTGAQPSVGLRCPSHPVARALLQAFGGAVAAPSANKFGRISPTRADHVAADYPDEDLLVLDGGEAEVGVESTIVDLSRIEEAGVVLLRPGAITPAQIEAVIGLPVRAPDAAAPRASGTLASHYAPRKPLSLVSADQIAQCADRRAHGGARVCVQPQGLGLASAGAARGECLCPWPIRLAARDGCFGRGAALGRAGAPGLRLGGGARSSVAGRVSRALRALGSWRAL